jgi:hypothetical protein
MMNDHENATTTTTTTTNRPSFSLSMDTSNLIVLQGLYRLGAIEIEAYPAKYGDRFQPTLNPLHENIVRIFNAFLKVYEVLYAMYSIDPTTPLPTLYMHRLMDLISLSDTRLAPSDHMFRVHCIVQRLLLNCNGGNNVNVVVSSFKPEDWVAVCVRDSIYVDTISAVLQAFVGMFTAAVISNALIVEASFSNPNDDIHDVRQRSGEKLNPENIASAMRKMLYFFETFGSFSKTVETQTTMTTADPTKENTVVVGPRTIDAITVIDMLNGVDDEMFDELTRIAQAIGPTIIGMASGVGGGVGGGQGGSSGGSSGFGFGGQGGLDSFFSSSGTTTTTTTTTTSANPMGGALGFALSGLGGISGLTSVITSSLQNVATSNPQVGHLIQQTQTNIREQQLQPQTYSFR